MKKKMCLENHQIFFTFKITFDCVNKWCKYKIYIYVHCTDCTQYDILDNVEYLLDNKYIDLPKQSFTKVKKHVERIERIDNICSSTCHESKVSNIPDKIESDQHKHSVMNTICEPVTKRELRTLFVDEKHKAIICLIPKVASSTWKSILMKLQTQKSKKRSKNENKDFLSAHGLTHLSSYNSSDIQEKLRTYFKFMFVRHPFERLFSGYKDKFIHKHNLVRRLKIYQTLGTFKDTSNIFVGENKSLATFQGFIKYILLKRKIAGLSMMNVHWQPYHHLCHPCRIHYDFIGKFDTFKEDTEYVIHKLKSNLQRSTNKLFKYIKPSSHDNYKDAFRNISLKDIKDLYKIYKGDIELFNYSVDFLPE